MLKAMKNPEAPIVWQLIFSQSKANGYPYQGNNLLCRNWRWPKNTFLQTRLQKIRQSQMLHFDTSSLSADGRFNLLYRDVLGEYYRN